MNRQTLFLALRDAIDKIDEYTNEKNKYLTIADTIDDISEITIEYEDGTTDTLEFTYDDVMPAIVYEILEKYKNNSDYTRSDIIDIDMYSDYNRYGIINCHNHISSPILIDKIRDLIRLYTIRYDELIGIHKDLLDSYEVDYDEEDE